MPFQKIEPAKVAGSITRQIEGLILKGILRAGERLPSERDLASRLGVSRPSLRDALTEMEATGLIETRAGSGVFVAQVLGSVFSPPLLSLFATHDEALFDYITFRRDLEALAAERAATHATEVDLSVLRDISTRMEAAHLNPNAKIEAQLDAELHMAIVEAAHNVVMLHMVRSMFEMLQAGVFYNRQLMFDNRDTRDQLLQQHRAMVEGITNRDPVAARAAVETHLGFIEQAMHHQIRDERHTETTRQRIAHKEGRKS